MCSILQNMVVDKQVSNFLFLTTFTVKKYFNLIIFKGILTIEIQGNEKIDDSFTQAINEWRKYLKETEEEEDQ